MVKEGADFFGRILIVLFVAILIGLASTESNITGYVVYEEESQNDFYDVKLIDGDTRKCADGSLYGECSSIIKPKYCVYGELVDYCGLCGCDAGEICSNNRCIPE
jgi:hypothetical protein